MMLHETVPNLGEWSVKALGTDIDMKVLERASQGVYSEHEMASVPPIYRQKYFVRNGASSHSHFAIAKAVRSLVTFAPFNLTSDVYPFKHGFDLVFCRNVLIYFDRPTATSVTDRLAGTLRPNGLLFVGHSEVGIVRPNSLKAEASAVYRRIER
jgi:chemotaxis protein methyltransferase CheR